MVAVYFDLKKAFDKTWRFDIRTKILHDLQFQDSLSKSIFNFLTDMYFRVGVSESLSGDRSTPRT